MNALIITDLHANEAPRFGKIGERGLNTRFVDLLNVLKQAKQWLLDHMYVEDLIIGGDVFDRRHFISFELYDEVTDALMALRDLVKKTTMIRGNHDMESDLHHALHVYDYSERVEVVETPKVVTLSDGESIYAIPYSYQEEEVAQAFMTTTWHGPVISHFAASGVPLETSYWLNTVVPLATLTKFSLTIFGHVHKPSACCAHCGLMLSDPGISEVCQCQRLGGKVVYVGAPMHFDFGDHGDRFGLWVHDAHVERVPFQAPKFLTAKWPRIPLVDEPGYLRVLGCPSKKIHEVQEAALRSGWLGVEIPLSEGPVLGASLSKEAQAELSSLTITPKVLREFVQQRLPDLQEGEVEELVEQGLHYLKRKSS